MSYKNDDLRIKNIEQLLPPIALLERFPASDVAAETVEKAVKSGPQLIHFKYIAPVKLIWQEFF